MKYYRTMGFLPDEAREQHGVYDVVSHEHSGDTWYTIGISDEVARAFVSVLVYDGARLCLEDLVSGAGSSKSRWLNTTNHEGRDLVLSALREHKLANIGRYLVASDIDEDACREADLYYEKDMFHEAVPVAKWAIGSNNLIVSLLFDDKYRPYPNWPVDMLRMWYLRKRFVAALLVWREVLGDRKWDPSDGLEAIEQLGREVGAYPMLQAVAAGVPPRDVLA